MTNMIRRQVFEVKLCGEKTAGLQEPIASVCRDRLPVVMDEVFSQVSPDGLISIDRLEIDLGLVPLEDLESELSTRVRKRLSEALRIEAGKIDSLKSKEGKGLSHKDAGPVENKKIGILKYFLRTGALPWQAGRSCSPGDLVSDALDFCGIKDFFKEELKRKISRQRAILQFDDSLLLKIAFSIRTGESARIGEFLESVRLIAGSGALLGTSEDLRFYAWEALFVALTSDRPLSEALRLVFEYTSKGNFEEMNAALKKIAPALTGDIRAAITEALREAVKRGDEKIAREIFFEEESLSEGMRTRTGATVHDIGSPAGEEDKNEFFVENGGAVLLWPYLPRFFASAGLLGEGAFKSHASALRAVHLLEYLVTGREDAGEHLLPLNKILCGLAPDALAAKRPAIEQNEKDEAEKLLAAVISHWKSLKSTSTEGLRKSFLQREGILLEVDGGYLLKVERRAYDMLLEALPWSIGVIRLPWMKKRVHVEW